MKYEKSRMLKYKIIKYNFCAYDSNDTSIQCQLPCRGIQ